jgi:hypothetical protein
MQYGSTLARSIGADGHATRTEAKTQALSWLAARLRWERTLEQLREGEVHDTPKAA